MAIKSKKKRNLNDNDPLEALLWLVDLLDKNSGLKAWPKKSKKKKKKGKKACGD